MRVPRSERTAFHRGGSGEPLVLIHGFTDTWTTWRPVLGALEARHDVYAPTLIGHLGGDPFPDPGAVSDALYADDLERKLDALGIEQAHLVGNSLGGWLSLVLAARGRAKSVVGLCPAGGWEVRTWRDRRLAFYFRRNAALMGTGEWWIDHVAARPRLRRLATRELIAPGTRLSATDARAMLEGAAGCAIVHRTIASSRREPLFGELGPIDVPIRILYGTEDRLLRWPGYYERLRRMLPDAEYLPLPGAGHLPMWDDPQAVAARVLEVTAPAGTLASSRNA